MNLLEKIIGYDKELFLGIIFLFGISLFIISLCKKYETNRANILQIAIVCMLIILCVLANNVVCYFFVIAVISILLAKENYLLQLIAMLTKTKEFWEHYPLSTIQKEENLKEELQEQPETKEILQSNQTNKISKKNYADQNRGIIDRMINIERLVLDDEEKFHGIKIQRNVCVRNIRTMDYHEFDGVYEDTLNVIFYEVKCTRNTNLISRRLDMMASFAFRYQVSNNKSAVINFMIVCPDEKHENLTSQLQQLKQNAEQKFCVQVFFRLLSLEKYESAQ